MPPIPKPPAPPAASSVTERTYETILRWIENREIGAGSVLDERRISEALEVSRTPLRNVLSRLQGEGYLVRLANGTMVVRDIGAGEVLELLLVRRLLEPEAAAMAAGRIPAAALQAARDHVDDPTADHNDTNTWLKGDEVHDLIAKHCGNRSLALMIGEARRRIRLSHIERVPGRTSHAREEHLAIIDALGAGDGKAAREAMFRHLENIREGFLAAFGRGAL